MEGSGSAHILVCISLLVSGEAIESCAADECTSFDAAWCNLNLAVIDHLVVICFLSLVHYFISLIVILTIFTLIIVSLSFVIVEVIEIVERRSGMSRSCPTASTCVRWIIGQAGHFCSFHLRSIDFLKLVVGILTIVVVVGPYTLVTKLEVESLTGAPSAHINRWKETSAIIISDTLLVVKHPAFAHFEPRRLRRPNTLSTRCTLLGRLKLRHLHGGGVRASCVANVHIASIQCDVWVHQIAYVGLLAISTL